MDYGFVRELTVEVSEENRRNIYQVLSEKGIEVFGKKDNAVLNVTHENITEFFKLCVSAADLDMARVLVVELGLENLLCSDEVSMKASGMSEVEKAEEEFYRKHKQNQTFAGIIIAVVIVFLIFNFFLS